MKRVLLPAGQFFQAEVDTGTAIVTTYLPARVCDEFDPRTWQDHEGPCYISLSDRVECCALVDRVDYGWALAPLPSGRPRRWGHTYGSGRIVEVDQGVYCIERPDHIYACRRPWGTGAVEWLHVGVCERAHGPRPHPQMIADHMRGETLMCTRDNLRWATRSENARNIAGSKVRDKFLKRMGAIRRSRQNTVR